MNFLTTTKKVSKTWKSYRAMLFLNVVWCKDVLFRWNVLILWLTKRKCFCFFQKEAGTTDWWLKNFFEVQSFQGHPNATWSHDCCFFNTVSRVSRISNRKSLFITGWNSQLVMCWNPLFYSFAYCTCFGQWRVNWRLKEKNISHH